MNHPQDLTYTESHEWIRTEKDGTLTIGITDHAQEAHGDLVFIELPEVGRKLAAEEACVVVESVKAASDVYAPVAGEVVALLQAEGGYLRGRLVALRCLGGLLVGLGSEIFQHDDFVGLCR